MPPTSPQKPNGWTTEHDAFVQRNVQNGEDARCIKILFETEYPGVVVSQDWVEKKVRETS